MALFCRIAYCGKSSKKPVVLRQKRPLVLMAHNILYSAHVRWVSFGFHALLHFRKKQQNINQETNELSGLEQGLSEAGRQGSLPPTVSLPLLQPCPSSGASRDVGKDRVPCSWWQHRHDSSVLGTTESADDP